MGYGGYVKKDEDLRDKSGDDKSSPTKENTGPGGFKPNENNPNFNPQQNRGNFMHTNQFHQPFNHHHHHHHHNFSGERYTPLPPSEVTCFKCGEKGI